MQHADERPKQIRGRMTEDRPTLGQSVPVNNPSAFTPSDLSEPLSEVTKYLRYREDLNVVYSGTSYFTVYDGNLLRNCPPELIDEIEQQGLYVDGYRFSRNSYYVLIPEFGIVMASKPEYLQDRVMKI